MHGVDLGRDLFCRLQEIYEYNSVIKHMRKNMSHILIVCVQHLLQVHNMLRLVVCYPE